MSDCDLDDDFDFDDDFGDDSEDSDREYDPNREYPRETDTNFICVSASSLIAEKLLKCGYNNKGVLCFLVRWKGFDEQLDDWVPSSDLPARLVDEFYCAKLNMEPPSLDFDEDYHSDLDEDGDYIPYVPLTQRQIKRQLREAGCFGKTRKPVTTLPKMVIQKLMGLVPSKELSLESVRAQVEQHRQRIVRLGLLNTRLQNYFTTRSRKPPPRPPDPPIPFAHMCPPQYLLPNLNLLAYFPPTI